jgi:hypothetical protein
MDHWGFVSNLKGGTTMRKALLILSILVTASFFNTMVLAAVSNDEVTSIKLKEADGLASQDTNTGSGVKTGHIQNSAVTTVKIADGAVTTVKILDSAVTSTKIANGAVTDAKISGLISASKISSSGLNADTVDGLHAADLAPTIHTHTQSQVTGLETALAGKSDVTHNHDTLYQKKYGKVAVVAQTGGDYTDPVAAMSALATWCGTPSATNACLLKIMPGVYDLGANVLQMSNYIDIEGSGENNTILKGKVNAVVMGASNTELRFLSVNSVPEPGYVAPGACYSSSSFAICNVDTSNMKITNVTVNVTTLGAGGTGIYNYGTFADITLNNVVVKIDGSAAGNGTTTAAIMGFYGAKLTMNNVNAYATGSNLAIGIQCNSACSINNTTANGFGNEGIGISGGGTLRNVYAEGSHYGLQSWYPGTITASQSTIVGPTIAVYYPYGTAYIGSSQIAGGGVIGANCAGVYDENYVFYANSCP